MLRARSIAGFMLDGFIVDDDRFRFYAEAERSYVDGAIVDVITPPRLHIEKTVDFVSCRADS
jgi:hypothetical protein